MIHAYDEILLERAASSLGRALDYSVHSLHRDLISVMDLFTATGLADDFGHGDIRLICGMSGIELAYEILERSGMSYERTLPRHTRSFSAEYWCGYTLALIQWKTCLSFDQIMYSFSPSGFMADYAKKRVAYLDSLPLDTAETERAEKIRDFGRNYAAQVSADFASARQKGSNLSMAGDTPLKRMRKKNGLSQSVLAKVSGIPVRTIQQYEQRQKDLGKASAEYLIALSRALNCDPSDLLEQQTAGA